MSQRLALIPHQVVQPLGRVAANWFSRTTSTDDQLRGCQRLIATLMLPLAAIGFGAILLSDPLVPLIFGLHWQPAAPVLAAMSGVMIFTSLFEVLRSYALVTRQGIPLMVARAMQFLAFAAGAIAGWLAGGTALLYIALGLSAAFVLAFSVQFVMVSRKGSHA